MYKFTAPCQEKSKEMGLSQWSKVNVWRRTEIVSPRLISIIKGAPAKARVSGYSSIT